MRTTKIQKKAVKQFKAEQNNKIYTKFIKLEMQSDQALIPNIKKHQL